MKENIGVVLTKDKFYHPKNYQELAGLASLLKKHESALVSFSFFDEKQKPVRCDGHLDYQFIMEKLEDLGTNVIIQYPLGERDCRDNCYGNLGFRIIRN